MNALNKCEKCKNVLPKLSDLINRTNLAQAKIHRGEIPRTRGVRWKIHFQRNNLPKG